MRHRWGWNRLGRDPKHRKALLRNLLIALIKHERIMTTLPKAKELRRTGDKIITLAKRGTDQSRGKAWNWLRHPTLMEKLYDVLKLRYVGRPGGYTRVLRAPKRRGDNAQMAIIEFVDNPFPPLRPPKEKGIAVQTSGIEVAADDNTVDCTEELAESLSCVGLDDGGLKSSSVDKEDYCSIPLTSARVALGRGRDLGTPV